MAECKYCVDKDLEVRVLVEVIPSIGGKDLLSRINSYITVEYEIEWKENVWYAVEGTEKLWLIIYWVIG